MVLQETTMTRPSRRIISHDKKSVRRRKPNGRVLLVFVSLLWLLVCGRLPRMTMAEVETAAQEELKEDDSEDSETKDSSEDPGPPSSDSSAASVGRAVLASLDSLGPITLTGRNFDKTIGDGNVWLIAFMAPWCSHCRAFEPSYDEIAHYFHGSGKQGVKVGKVDAEAERALAARFEVPHYPSFYVVDGWSVYRFGPSQSKNTLIRFAAGGYKKQDPIPFYSSPVGPWGIVEGKLMAAGMSLGDMFSWLQASLGISPLLAGALVSGSIFMGCFISIVFLAIVITPKVKAD